MLRRLKSGIIVGGLLALALLAGCSALQLGYRQAPMLAHWWLDGYVDFDDVQSQRVKLALAEWHGWHRQTQVLAYADHLAQARRLVAADVQPEQVCRWNDEARRLLEPAVDRALPAAAEVVLTLQPEQLRRIEAQHRKRSEKLREELLPADADAQARHTAAVQRNVKRVEEFYGSVTPVQRQLLDDAQRASPVDAATWLAQRDQRHREMMDTLRELVRDQPDGAQAQQRLRRVADRFNGRAPVGGPSQSEAWARATCEWTARVHNASTPTQRQHLARKLGQWEGDLRAVALEAVAQTGRTPPVAAATGQP